MSKVIAVVSGKGGVGKSTISVGIGLAFAKDGKKTLIVEMDFGLRGIDIMLGISDKIVYDLGDLLEGRCTISSAIIDSPRDENLAAIAAPVEMERPVDYDEVRFIIAGLKKYFDVILLDMPAGLYPTVDMTLSAADEALVVATPDPVSIRDGGKTVQLLRRRGFDRCRLVVNRFSKKAFRKKSIRSIDEMIDGVGAQLIGVVPEDKKTALFHPALSLIEESGPLFLECADMAKRIDGIYIPLTIRV
jgi:septum site-determining protein MinD